MIKAPEGPPRKDSRLGNVIISEKKDKAISKHQVSQQWAAPITKHNPFSRVLKKLMIWEEWNTNLFFFVCGLGASKH